MAETEGPENPRDPLEEAAEKLRQKIVVAKFVFGNVVLPKAKKFVGKVRDIAEDRLNKVRDSFDPTKGLERNAREVREWLKSKGLSPKDADKIIEKTVKTAVKKPKKEGKKDE